MRCFILFTYSLFLICFGFNSFGQGVDTTVNQTVIFSNPQEFFEKVNLEKDTVIENFDIVNLRNKSLVRIGNLAQDGYFLLFQDIPVKLGFRSRYFIHDTINNFYYDTKVPYSKASYSWGSGVEEHFRAVVAMNVNPFWNVCEKNFKII